MFSAVVETAYYLEADRIAEGVEHLDEAELVACGLLRRRRCHAAPAKRTSLINSVST